MNAEYWDERYRGRPGGTFLYAGHDLADLPPLILVGAGARVPSAPWFTSRCA
ncbi:hypothetical protein [Spirillospora sp. NPDC047279]|uniref:hypothetical protein n=1 Tax=Spirillospora sp. NPDC047279 TaxID=3155478 RepID=UPI0033E8D39C